MIDAVANVRRTVDDMECEHPWGRIAAFEDPDGDGREPSGPR